MSNKLHNFIPATREIEIGEGVVYRPIRSWHSNVPAGERCENWPPRTYTHRIYWKKGTDPNATASKVFTVSAFLSYPKGMSIVDHYHWEICPSRDDCDVIERFDAEDAMEDAVRELFRAHANSCAELKSRCGRVT